ncbi:uncharacterized protein LOC143359166 [Halictus rubicundus]|uniref:uncharacterized protein LOC143359166 n=1 Tax=Halictus rubicundus TaxID=77578 RepID=UPI0040360BDD
MARRCSDNRRKRKLSGIEKRSLTKKADRLMLVCKTAKDNVPELPAEGNLDESHVASGRKRNRTLHRTSKAEEEHGPGPSCTLLQTVKTPQQCGSFKKQRKKGGQLNFHNNI